MGEQFLLEPMPECPVDALPYRIRVEHQHIVGHEAQIKCL